MKGTITQKCEYLIDIGLLLFALFLPISIAAAQFFWGLLMLAWIVKVVAGGAWRLKSTFLDKAILVFIILSIVSVIFSVDARRSMRGLQSEILVSIFFLIAHNVKSAKQVKKLLVFFLMGSVIVSIQGILQYFIGVDMLSDEIIAKPDFLSDAPLDVLRFLSMHNGRALASRGHPLTLAEGLVFALCIGMPLFLVGKPKDKPKLAIGLVIMGVALVFTFSRGPWFSTAAVMVLLIAFLLISASARIKKMTLIVGVLIIVMVIASGAISVMMKGSRMSIVERFKNLKDADRIKMWETGVDIVKDYPLWGVGMKNISTVYSTYNPEHAKKTQSWGELHNNFIHIMASRGIPALVAFVWIFISYFKNAFRVYFETRLKNDEFSMLVIACVTACLGFLFAGMTEYNFGDSEIVMMLWFVMGLTVVLVREGYKNIEGEISN
ncbi:MAG: O-antigen ligase family protein [bacterium]